jgi:excisionase family DNA binding protein
MRHASPILTKSGTPVTPAGKPAPFRAEGSVHTMAENTPGDMSEAHFLTIAEVAAKMRVSKMTVYRLVHGGELPAVRVGRSFRVTEDDVNEYLRKSFYNAG